MDDAVTFGAWVKRRRKELGWTQERLAEAASCSWEMVRKIEAGSARPSEVMAEALLAALAVPAAAQAALVHLARRGTGAGTSTTAVAAPPPPAAPIQLPDPPTPFIGREDAIGAVVERLRDGGARLLTLAGPGGVGKTRLALQAARAIAEDFADGVHFVDLAPLNDPALVAWAIARTLGLGEGSGESALDTLRNSLRARRMLLVLDNFEQVVGAGPDLASLLQAAPGLRLLVTSRVPLHVYGEREYAVDPLGLPALDPPPPRETLLASEAVRLFAARAAAIRADFVLNAENALTIAQICARLDGLPLAIELAAARIKMLTPQAMLARLDARLRLLTSGSRDLPQRQQTLRNAIDWSYDLLDPAERTLFARLAVFSGGATLEAIDAVCDIDGALQLDTLDGIDSLLNKNLLRQGAGGDGQSRFWMLETIGEYAGERLAASGAEEALRAAHASYYLDLAETAGPQLVGPQQGEWLARLEDDSANFRAVLERAQRRGEIGLGLRLAVGIWRFWQIRGHLSEGRGWLEGLLQEAAGVPAALRAAALQAAGSLSWTQGDYPRSVRLLTTALALYRELGELAGVAAVLISLGNSKRDQGEYEQAAACYEEALAVQRALGNRRGVAVALNNLGILARRQGDYARTVELCEQSLEIRRQLGDSWGIAISLLLLGDVAAMQHDYRRAKAYLNESLSLRQTLSDYRGIAEVLNALVQVARQAGEHDEMVRYQVDSMRLFLQIGDLHSVGACLQSAALTLADMAQSRDAARLLGAAAVILDATGGLPWDEELDQLANLTAHLQQALGEDAYKAAFAAGGGLSADQAINIAVTALQQH